ATYSFKHALVQEAAYESLLKGRRRDLHARVARALVAQLPAEAAVAPEVLARHCAAGELLPEAIDAYRRAGDQAAARLAYHEAHSYFARALELLSALPEDARSEEHTSELQSLRHLVCRLLLEKK